MIRRYPGQSLMMAMLIASVFCLSGHAQIANGTIRGTVTDSKGAVLQNATVVLVNQGTAEQTTQATNKDGYYTFTALSPTDYTVKVTAPGFDAWEVKLTLRVAQEAVIDAKLMPGKVQEVVTVSDATPLVDAADGTVSDVKETTRIETIPVIDSNFLSIVAFTPGVVANSYGGQGAGYTRVNGIPGGSMTFEVDGESANDRMTNDLQITPQALQTIQELKVTTSNGGAEYATPGVVEVVTKSGTNQFHGQADEIYQDGGFEAWQYNSYYPGAHHPHNVFNNFGGQLGGPVLLPKLYNGKNKTFFYFDVEKKINHKIKPDQELVYQTNWEQGDFSDLLDSTGTRNITIYDPMSGVYNPATGYVNRTQFAGNKITSGISPIAAKIMSFMPAPNVNVNTAGQIDPAQFNYGFDWINPNAHYTDNELRYTIKIDQLIGKNLLSARYTNISDNILTPDEGGSQGALLTPNVGIRSGHNGVLSYTSPIGGHMVNEARVGIQMFNNYSGPEPGIWPPLSQLGTGLSGGVLPSYPGLVGLPAFYPADPNNFFNFSTIQDQNPTWAPNQDITLGDNYSWIRGRHEMKFGFQVTNTRVTSAQFNSPGGDYFFDGAFTALETAGSSTNPGAANPAGYTAYTGSSLADFLLGDVDVTQYNQQPVFHTHQTDYAGYATDNFKVSPRLTLNLGVRWEYWSPYEDAGGLSADVDFNHNAACVIPAALGGGSCVSAGTPGYPTWFQQTSPIVMIPDSGAAQHQTLNAEGLLADEAAGLPVETASQAGVSSSLWNMPKNNWAPRLGFAYQLNDKTVIRGGYGMYYWTMPLAQYHSNTRLNDPWATIVFPATDPSMGEGYGPPDGNWAPEIGFPFAPINPAYTTAGWQNQCDCTTLPSNYVNPRQLGLDFVTPALTNITNSSGWSVEAWDPNYKAQRAQEWNLTAERVLPGNFAASVSYVGNHGGRLPDYDPINASLPRSLQPSTLTPTSGLPYPIYSVGNEDSMDEFRFVGYSNHNEGRAEIKHTFRGSFILQSYFTYGRSLGTSEGTANSSSGLELQPATLTNNAPLVQRLRAIYAPDSYIPEKTFVVNGHYELPFGKDKPFLANSNTAVNEVVSGWNVSAFYMWHSGLFFSPYYSPNPGINNSGNNLTLSPNALHPGGILPKSQRTREMWFDYSIWDPSGGGNCGTPVGATAYAGQTYLCRDNAAVDPNNYGRDTLNGIPRNYMTGPGFSNLDGTLYKVTPIGGHMKLDLEMQVFNVLNHTNLGLPNQAGQINGTVGTPPNYPTAGRFVQFLGKLEF